MRAPLSSPLHYQVWLTAILLPRLFCHLSCSAMLADWLHSTTAWGDNNLHWSDPSAYPAVTNGNRLLCGSTIDCPTHVCVCVCECQFLGVAAPCATVMDSSFPVTHQHIIYSNISAQIETCIIMVCCGTTITTTTPCRTTDVFRSLTAFFFHTSQSTT